VGRLLPSCFCAEVRLTIAGFAACCAFFAYIHSKVRQPSSITWRLFCGLFLVLAMLVNPTWQAPVTHDVRVVAKWCALGVLLASEVMERATIAAIERRRRWAASSSAACTKFGTTSQ